MSNPTTTKIIDDLLTELDTRYPNRTELRKLDAWEYGYAAGSRSVVEWVKYRLSNDYGKEESEEFQL